MVTETVIDWFNLNVVLIKIRLMSERSRITVRWLSVFVCILHLVESIITEDMFM